MGDVGSLLTGIGTMLLAVITALASWAAVGEYRKSGDRDRTRVLMELFDRFYAKPDYQDVYLAFDDSKPALRKQLLEAMGTSGELHDPEVQQAEWQLTAYLNFFEMVASLVKLGRITDQDFDTLFNYPLACLNEAPGMAEYVSKNTYTRLQRYVKKGAVGSAGRGPTA